MKTSIEWTDHTWNPIRARNLETGKVGWFCEKVSAECANCYAEKRNVNTFFGNGIRYAADQRSKVEIFSDRRVMVQPLHWRAPKKIFPCSMTDLYGAFVPEEMIREVYDVMDAARWHTFIVLTKRPARRREFLTRRYAGRTPAPNIWELVSCGTQPTADEFIPELLQTPAAVRGVSAEPLLGPVDLREFIGYGTYDGNVPGSCVNIDGEEIHAGAKCRTCGWGYPNDPDNPRRVPGIDWVIVGGESGPGARPMSLEWAASLVDQCAAAGAPVFIKQLGSNPIFTRATDADTFFSKPRGKGGDPDEWPPELRVRQFPAAAGHRPEVRA